MKYDKEGKLLKKWNELVKFQDKALDQEKEQPL